MRFDVILFDLGGTLINYRGPVSDWHAMERMGLAAVHRLLHQNGLIVPEEEDFATYCFEQLRVGWYAALAGERNLRLEEILLDSCTQQGLVVDPALLHRAVMDYTAAISLGARPREGVAQTLATLKQQGRKIGLISNTMWPPEAHTKDLTRFGLDGFFDVLLYSVDHGHWKPGRRIFEIALEMLGAPAERAVYVGDNPHDDVDGAHGAGMRAIWLRTAEYPHDAGAAADAIINHIPEMLQTLAQWEAT